MKITQRFGKHITPEILSPLQSRLLKSRLDCTLGKKRGGWEEGKSKRTTSEDGQRSAVTFSPMDLSMAHVPLLYMVGNRGRESGRKGAGGVREAGV